MNELQNPDAQLRRKERRDFIDRRLRRAAFFVSRGEKELLTPGERVALMFMHLTDLRESRHGPRRTTRERKAEEEFTDYCESIEEEILEHLLK